MKKAILRGARFLVDSVERNISLLILGVVCVSLLRNGITLGAFEIIALLFVPVVVMTMMYRFIVFIVNTAEEGVTTWVKKSKTN